MGPRQDTFDSRGVSPRARRSDAVAASQRVSGLLADVRGVLFDLPGVLYDATRWRRWLWQLAVRMGVNQEIEAFYQPWDASFSREVYSGRRHEPEAFETFLLAAGLARGQVEELLAAGEARRRHWETSARPLPGVREAVVKLRAAGLELGVLANSPHSAEELRRRLAQFVPADAVSEIISSRDLECAKPDVRCYRAGLAALSLPAGEVAFVSSVAIELLAAKNQGLATVALNLPGCAAADLCLETFAELPGRLRTNCSPAVAG